MFVNVFFGSFKDFQMSKLKSSTVFIYSVCIPQTRTVGSKLKIPNSDLFTVSVFKLDITELPWCRAAGTFMVYRNSE